MSTDTTLQIGTTPNPIASNAQDFSGSDDEIMDGFAEGPLPDGADRYDDGTPLGLGGEKGKQSEPASSTLDADLVNGTTPGETIPPEDTATSEPEDAGEIEATDDIPAPEEPDFPPALLQMAGYADAKAAQADGFKSTEDLFAAVKWRSRLLSEPEEPVSPQGLYRQKEQPKEEPVQETEVEPFQLPADKLDILDEDLQDILRQMNEHYQKEVQSLKSVVSQREVENAIDESVQFDELVQTLNDWKDVFGEGSGVDLAQKGKRDAAALTSFNHRAMLFDAVQAVREVNAKQGYKPMTLEQEMQWALMQRYPDKFQETISGKSSGIQSGAVASRPTQRRTPPKSHNAKVLADVDAMLRKKHGYALSRADKDDFDGEI